MVRQSFNLRPVCPFAKTGLNNCSKCGREAQEHEAGVDKTSTPSDDWHASLFTAVDDKPFMELSKEPAYGYIRVGGSHRVVWLGFSPNTARLYITLR